MRLCAKKHDEVVYETLWCPVCEAQKEIEAHRKCEEELREVIRLVAQSQGWAANDPNEERWTKLYEKVREFV